MLVVGYITSCRLLRILKIVTDNLKDYRNAGKHPRVNFISSRVKNTVYSLKLQGLRKTFHYIE